MWRRIRKSKVDPALERLNKLKLSEMQYFLCIEDQLLIYTCWRLTLQTQIMNLYLLKSSLPAFPL